MSTIYLYAELLLNIRQVTVFVILPSACDETTGIELDAERVRLRLRHDDHEATIELPCLVDSHANLMIPATATEELSFRLAVNPSAKLSTQDKEVYENNIPWSASKLTPEAQLACGSCGNQLVTDVKVWKDLPSGGWADMMDFWHCHKPTIEDDNNASAGSTKGYAASKVLGPTAGVGLVDVSYFLLADSDCAEALVCLRFYFEFYASVSLVLFLGNKKEACFRRRSYPIARSPIQMPNSKSKNKNRSMSYLASASMRYDGLVDTLIRHALLFHRVALKIHELHEITLQVHPLTSLENCRAEAG